MKGSPTILPSLRLKGYVPKKVGFFLRQMAATSSKAPRLLPGETKQLDFEAQLRFTVTPFWEGLKA